MTEEADKIYRDTGKKSSVPPSLPEITAYHQGMETAKVSL